MKDEQLTTSQSGAATICASKNSLSMLDSHMPVLDGIRGVAILMVMLFHFLKPSVLHANEIPFAIAQAGWIGVDLFFVLSGFLITGILLRTKDDPHYLRNFYMRRTLRIFPLYYAFLVAIFVVCPLVTALNTSGFRYVAKHQFWLWTYTTNFGQYLTISNPFRGGWIQVSHLWSLAVEEQFYLIWPAVVLLCSRNILKWLCVFIILGAVIFRIYSNTQGEGLVLRRADALIVGGLLAILVRDQFWKPHIRGLASRIMLVTGCLIVGIAVWRGEFDRKDVVVKAIGMSTVILFFGASLIVIMSWPTKHWCVKILNFSVLKLFGKYSYCIYIVHFSLDRVMFKSGILPLTHRPTTVFWLLMMYLLIVLKIAASFGIAWLSWHLFEKHFLKLKHLFVCKSTHPLTLEAGTTTN